MRTAGLEVTEAADAGAAVQLAVDEFGALNVVVNNAGYATSAPIEERTIDDFRAQIETNLFGVVIVSKAALPVLRKQRVQVTSPPSAACLGGAPTRPRYLPSKASPRYSATSLPCIDRQHLAR